MKKKTNGIIDLISGLFTRAPEATSGMGRLFQDWLASGDPIMQDGLDLLHVTADGRIERIEGFFTTTGDFADASVPAELMAQLRKAIDFVDPAPVQLAQATTNSATDASNAADATIPLDVPIAKVAQASGSVVVIRNGLSILLSAGDSVYLGDVISTQVNSQVKLNFIKVDDGTVTPSSATVGAGTRVTVSGQIVASDAAKVFQANLNVDSGVVAVDKFTSPDIKVQVETPSGRVAVPQDGLVVAVEAATKQTSVSQPEAASGGAANVPAAVTFVNANGQEAQLQIGAAPVVLPASNLAAAQAVSESLS